VLHRVAAALLLAVLLTGCVGEEGLAPAPSALPSSVASLSLTSGQYLVTPSPGVDLEAAATKVRALPGVQAAAVREGVLDVEFTGAATEDQHRAVLVLLAPLGQVIEGV
jgi:hypothetical protein